MAACRYTSWLLLTFCCQVFVYGTASSVEDSLLRERNEDGTGTRFCVNSYCKGLFDKDLKLCYKIFCARDLLESDQYTDCILDNCGHHRGFIRRVCVYDKCSKIRHRPEIKDKTGSSTERERTFNVLDRFMDEVWSGELSGTQPTAPANKLDEQWYPDFEKSLERNEFFEEMESSPEKKCRATCKERALNGEEDYEACYLATCKSTSSLITKRWSTRMCMESHCKAANNKVQYFLCGKQHCHK